ncbi:hypothetical protein C8T65DRAFT_735718 [Cerioporus squamosus]|nr:hypothetical protein C8T65DRAFT_750150 [Cerioporus squamosus]KAI0720778.1 hypothetical protein C8T65DRAFT_735718 [Cerioporus squamosus]
MEGENINYWKDTAIRRAEEEVQPGIPRGFDTWAVFKQNFQASFAPVDEVDDSMVNITTIQLKDYASVDEFNASGFKFVQLDMKVFLSILLENFAFKLSDTPICWNYAGIRFPTDGSIIVIMSLVKTAKRSRTPDDSVAPAGAIVKKQKAPSRGEFWFDDGNLVITTGDTMFKVY